MKRTVLFLLAALITVSCSQSPEEKAQKLVEGKIKNALYLPDTYEAVETVLDSAFYPKDDPALFEKALKMCYLAMDAQEYDEKMKDAKRSMSIWSGPYMSTYGRNQYNEAKAEYEQYSDKMEGVKAKIQKVVSEIEKMAETERHFIGYKVNHKYRAQNNSGNTLMGSHIFLVNEDMTKIIADYDPESKDYIMVQALFDRWAEETDEVEGAEENE